MCVDDRAEQFPSATAAIHAKHSEYLEEAQTAQSRCGEDAIRTSTVQTQSDDRSHDHNEI